MKRSARRLTVWVFFLFLVGFFMFFALEFQGSARIIRNFDDCVSAGNFVINSVPRRCEISKDQFIVDISEINESLRAGGCDAYQSTKYPASSWNGTVSPVDYSSHNGSEKFKDEIEKSVKKGVNFAGHYIVASWKCGVSCEESGIIDAKSGKILVLGIGSQYGVEVNKASNLFVINPQKKIPKVLTKEERSTLTSSYYIFRDNTLVFSCREKIK